MTKNNQRTVLLVDDDDDLRLEVKNHLEKQGFHVLSASDGKTALNLASSQDPDIVVLDINFPDSGSRKGPLVDGIEVLRILRESGSIPILMLSATNIPSVKVMTLTLGADDYVPKPVDLNELSARIEAILRRAGHADPEEERPLAFKRLRLDPGERRVWKDGNLVELTGIEFDLLHTLARRPMHVFTRDRLIDLAWKDSICVPKAVDVHIAHIRKKIEDVPSAPTLIVTVRGTGYRFEDAPIES